MPAPTGSKATCGAPSGSPAKEIGWQISNRHPLKLACFRVAITLPSTRAKYIGQAGGNAVQRLAPQKMRNLSTMTHRRTRVKVRGFEIPSPVVVAMEKLG